MRRIHRGIIHQEEDSLLLEVVYHRRGWANAPRHRCIIELGNPTGGQPFRSNEKEPRASIQEGARSFSLSLSLESRDMENQKRWRTGKRGLQKSMEVSEDISPFPTFSSKLCSRAFHVFPETVVSERGDLEQVFFEKNKKLKFLIVVELEVNKPRASNDV